MRSAAVVALALAACGHAAPAPAPPPYVPPPKPADAGAPADAAPTGPPVARTVDVTDTQFGVTTTDPYRWMEGDDNAERTAWLTAQGDHAAAWLTALPGRDALAARVRELGLGTGAPSSVQLAGGRTFYLRVEPGESLSKLIVREPDGTDRVLVDPSTLGTADHHAALNAWSTSPDGTKVAYDLALGGGEVSVLHVMDVATGADLPDQIERVWGQGSAHWLDDGKRFFYEQMPANAEGADAWLHWTSRLHVLGTPVTDDVTMIDGDHAKSFALRPEELPGISAQTGTRWAIAIAGGARNTERVAVARLDRLDRSGKAATRWAAIGGYDDLLEDAWVHGDRVYLRTAKGAPLGRVVSMPCAKPDLAHARVEIAEDAAGPLVNVVPALDAMYAVRMIDGRARVERKPWKGKLATIALPFDGWVDDVATDVLRDGVTLDEQGWVVPGRYLAYDLKKKALAPIGLAVTTSADYSNVVADEVNATSADGTAVPLSILHAKDVALDHSHPTVVGAYGGYGAPQVPSFGATRLAWIEQGGVWAECHIRGGGEKGFAWQDAGSKQKKMNGVHDLEACGQALIDLGYTSTPHLFAQGGSLGGIVMGRALTERPDLFAAVNIQVGIVNPLRMLFAPNGANQIGELGDPATEAGYTSIAEVDPYVHVTAGTAYPAVLFSIGVNDQRVAPWMTAKMAARLLASSTSGAPILVRVDADAGHGLGSTRDQVFAARADEWAFFLAVSGDPAFAPPSR